MPNVTATTAIAAGQIVSRVGQAVGALTRADLFSTTTPFATVLTRTTSSDGTPRSGYTPRRQPALVTAAWNFTLVINTSRANVVLQRFALNGSAASSVTLSAGTSVSLGRIQELSNGSLLCTWSESASAGSWRYAIVNPDTLAIVKAAGQIGETTLYGSTCYHHDAVALSGGGFVVVYQLTATFQLRAVKLDNTGTQTVAPVAIQSQSNYGQTKVVELSDGNIGVAHANPYGATNQGLWAIVLNSATLATIGTPVLLNSSQPNAEQTSGPEIAAGTGAFAVQMTDGNGLYTVAVVSNASVLQGSVINVDTTGTRTYSQGLWPRALWWDPGLGVFWHAYRGTDGGTKAVQSLSTTGVAGAIILISTVGESSPIDVAYDAATGLTLVLEDIASGSTTLYVFTSGTTAWTLNTSIAIQASFLGTGYARVLARDGAAWLYTSNNQTTGALTRNIINLARRAILGIARAAAGAGQAIDIESRPGVYTVATAPTGIPSGILYFDATHGISGSLAGSLLSIRRSGPRTIA